MYVRKLFYPNDGMRYLAIAWAKPCKHSYHTFQLLSFNNHLLLNYTLSSQSTDLIILKHEIRVLKEGADSELRDTVTSTSN